MALTHLAHLKRIKRWLVPPSGFLTEFADLSGMRAIRNVAPDSDSAAASTRTSACRARRAPDAAIGTRRLTRRKSRT